MLTRAGWWTLGIGSALVVFAIPTGYVDIGYVGAACLIAVALGFGWVMWRPRLRIRREIDPTRVTVGDVALGMVTVENISRRSALALVARDRMGTASVDVPLPRLKPGEHRLSKYRLPTERRAVLTIGPLVVSRTDPFGLASFEQEFGETTTLWVHPRRHALVPLPATLQRSLEVATSDMSPRGTMAFHTLREYVPGDDRRHIHWRTTARTGTLMVRQYVDTSLPDLTILLDTRRDRHTDDSFEQAVEAAASLVVACTERRYPVHIRTTDGTVVDFGDMSQPTRHFLDWFAGVELTEDGDLAKQVDVLRSRPGGMALVVVTAQPEEAELRRITRLRRRYRAVAVADLNPDPERPALAPPGIALMRVETGVEFARRWNAGVLQ